MLIQHWDTKNLLGLSIIGCYRLFIKNEYETIPDSVRDQESDGITYLKFSNGEIHKFSPLTEKFSIQVKKEKDVSDGSTEITGNTFWKQRIAKRIVSIELIYGQALNPSGIRFVLENGLNVNFLYISESDYTFDGLIIK